MALTIFSDLTEQEFQAKYTRVTLNSLQKKISAQYNEVYRLSKLPDSEQKRSQKINELLPIIEFLPSPSDPITGPPIDWSCKFLSIKNQGPLCGSCYAIVTTDTI